jgi:hypothetical protein
MASPRRGGEVRPGGACQYADRRRLLIVALRPAVFDRYVLALNETGFPQTIAERGYIKCKAVGATRCVET